MTQYEPTPPTSGDGKRRGRKPRGEYPLTGAERQARYRRRQAGNRAAAPLRPPRSIRYPSRPQQWHAAVATLVALQSEYAAWLDASLLAVAVARSRRGLWWQPRRFVPLASAVVSNFGRCPSDGRTRCTVIFPWNAPIFSPNMTPSLAVVVKDALLQLRSQAHLYRPARARGPVIGRSALIRSRPCFRHVGHGGRSTGRPPGHRTVLPAPTRCP